MDLILKFYDRILLTPYVYPLSWSEDFWLRQYISLFSIVTIHSLVIYLTLSSLVYWFVFDKNLLKHPKFLKNQEKLEIMETCKSLPFISLLTNIVFFLEIRGYSKLYDKVEDSSLGWFGIFLYGIFFVLFTDMLIYWIHRGLHHRLFYKRIHKLHHKWIIPTPFASHAFHPIDGFMQSLPYHLYVFFFPFHKIQYLVMFFFVNLWTVSIHDADYRVIDKLKPIINGSAHHTDHHLYFDYNYGQFFTLWDRIGGSFRNPSAFEGQDIKTELKIEKKTQ